MVYMGSPMFTIFGDYFLGWAVPNNYLCLHSLSCTNFVHYPQPVIGLGSIGLAAAWLEILVLY